MDSAPWAAAGGFMSICGPKNGGWVNLGQLGCDMALEVMRRGRASLT